MEKQNINFFKIIIIIILVWIGYSLHNLSINGRYQMVSDNGKIIIDTRTGSTYFLYHSEDKEPERLYRGFEDIFKRSKKDKF